MKSDALNLAGGADRLLLIETFVRIVEAGSLSAAADQLGSTQPTISASKTASRPNTTRYPSRAPPSTRRR